ncbi:hypothetical protein GCM10023116_01620 [Kistimonas scapharcae]|uniref:Uncharacterized protein n=1 Tax=Kistimonas scapharcae TaxID=1036133 RepID=A0ABP8UYI0_9GAMM
MIKNLEISGERQEHYHPDEQVIEIVIPIILRRRGGKTHIETSDWDNVTTDPARRDTALIKALAQAHTWKGKIEAGHYKDILDLARKLGISDTYVARIMRLTMLSPEIQEIILKGKYIGGRTLADFMGGVPILWKEQEEWLKQ